MNISKFKLLIKLLFGGTEAALDYLLDVFNNILSSESVARYIEKAVAIGKYITEFMDDHQSWCPSKWLPYYRAVYTAIMSVVDAFSDGKVTPDDIKRVKEQFQIAYATWRAED